MYDSNVGTVGFDGSNHIRTACTEPSGSLNETYQYDPGASGFMPGSVSSSKRSLRLLSLWYGCDTSSDLRSVPEIGARLSPVASVRIVAPGALHGFAVVTVLIESATSFDAGPLPWPFTATTL